MSGLTPVAGQGGPVPTKGGETMKPIAILVIILAAFVVCCLTLASVVQA